MKIIINRIRVKEQFTDGHLSIDGQHICDTTEATSHLLPEGTYTLIVFKCTRSKRQLPLIRLDDNRHYDGTPIPLKCIRCTALATAIEKLRLSKYNKLQLAISNKLSPPKLVALEKVLDAEVQNAIHHAICRSHDVSNCPRLHHGNGVFDRHDGSILVGRRLQPGVVLQSRPIFDRLYERIEKAISRGHTIQLIIRSTK